jgi:hypothetical protein
MTKFATTLFVAVTLVQPVLSVAGDQPGDSRAKQSSFVPHPHTNHHVYGAPIQPAIVGHAKTSHHRPASKKRSSSATNRGAQKGKDALPANRRGHSGATHPAR